MSSWNNSIANNHMAVIEMLARMGNSKRKGRGLVNKELLKKNLDLINQVGSSQPSTVQVQQQSIDLSGLFQKLSEIKEQGQNLQQNQQAADPAEGQTIVQAQVTMTQSVSISMELHINQPGTIAGLELRNAQTAESDRYQFDFAANGQELTITDKWTRHSTRIWGDPHVDLDDMEGDHNGEFSDLTKSNLQTSFMLQDSTRVTITAEDNSVMQNIDIIKGNQHIHGTGVGGSGWAEGTQLFAPGVLQDGASAGASIAQGDTVYAGGDGSDWYDGAGKLVWGHGDVATVKDPPLASLEFKYSQTFEQSVVINQVVKSA